MNPSIAANQQRLFLEFFAALRPHLRRDSALPRRVKELLARHRAIGSRDRKLYRELIFTAVRFLPWVEAVFSDRRAAAGRQAGPATSAFAKLRRDESTGPTEAELAAKLIAWLAPELKPTAPYRAAVCGDWPAVPATLAEKAAVLSALPEIRTHSRSLRKWTENENENENENDSPAPSSSLPAPSFPPAALLPKWFHEHCPAAFLPPHLDAINTRASVWVRIQCYDRNLVLDEFRARNWTFTVADNFPDAICLPPNAEVADTDAYRRGFIEIQDFGSQLVLAGAGLKPGGHWFDACAGAGGKTLQLARLLGSDGHVDATDIRPEILEELRDRAKRARLDNIAIVKEPAGDYDGVLVDAPCSGSGTWRRQPHLKWCVKPETIATFAATQLEILVASAARVRPGGQLVYATCSLSHHENHDVVAAFLKVRPEFAPQPPATAFGDFDGLGTSLLPGTLNTDGFYVATLRRP